MFDIDKSYGFDEKAAETGVKMYTGPDKKEDYFIVRRLPNDDYVRELSKKQQANHKMLEYLRKQDEAKYDKLNTKLLCEVTASTVLIGWGSVVVRGTSVKYSVAAATKLLVDYRDFKNDIIEFATDNDNYPLKVDVKELKKP